MAGPEGCPWAAFVAKELTEELSRVRQLADADPDPAAPYAALYKAADSLGTLADRAAALAADDSPDSKAAAAAANRLRLERGLLMLQTDLLCQGEPAVSDALAQRPKWPAWVALRAHNALGALWCDRDNGPLALEHLAKAQAAYEDYAAGRAGPNSSSAAVAPGTFSSSSNKSESGGDGAAGSSTGEEDDSWAAPLQPANLSEAIEDEYTQTLFYLAQVHGLVRDRRASAAYCGATLNRQARHPDSLDLNDWVQNALQLSGFHIDDSCFAMARHCLEAVRALLQRLQAERQGQAEGQQQQRAEEQVAEQGQGSAAGESNTEDKGEGAKASEEQQQRGQEEEKGENKPSSAVKEEAPAEAEGTAEDAAGGRRRRTDQQQLIAQNLQPAAAAAGQANAAAPAAGDAAAAARAATRDDLLALLESDVAANVCLAWGKLFLHRLVVSHGVELLARPPPGAGSAGGSDAVPEAARFTSIPGVPALESLPEWGDGALVGDYEGAKALANAALPLLIRALSYYHLDGWVTEHVQTQMEISNVYRLLADFDPEPRRRAAAHLSRTRAIGPLVGAFSPEHYPGLAKSVMLEAANAWREVSGAREEQGAAAAEIAAAASQSASHYQAFLDSLCPRPGAPLPDRIGADDESHALRAAFYGGCMLHTAAKRGGGGGGGGPAGKKDKPGQQRGGKQAGDGSSGAAAAKDTAAAPAAGAAQALLRWMASYVNRHGLEDAFGEEAAFAVELAGLLDQRDELMAEAAAAAASGDLRGLSLM